MFSFGTLAINAYNILRLVCAKTEGTSHEADRYELQQSNWLEGIVHVDYFRLRLPF